MIRVRDVHPLVVATGAAAVNGRDRTPHREKSTVVRFVLWYGPSAPAVSCHESPRRSSELPQKAKDTNHKTAWP